jgi:hypothetical protein
VSLWNCHQFKKGSGAGIFRIFHLFFDRHISLFILVYSNNLGLVSNTFHMSIPYFLELIYPSFVAPIINYFIASQFTLRIPVHPSNALTNFISQHESASPQRRDI